jgi:Winged helix DNA-binding domain
VPDQLGRRETTRSVERLGSQAEAHDFVVAQLPSTRHRMAMYGCFMTERVLSTRELNRALLARQLLLERSPLPVPRALEAVAGLQTQYAPAAYVGLWSRLRDFRREDLTRALEDRRAVQATLMRSTIHTVSAEDYWLFAAGVREGRREWWLRAAARNLVGVDMAEAACPLRRRLEQGPARTDELKALLAASGAPAVTWQGVGLWLDLVRIPPSGTWEQRRADLYALADSWLGVSDPGAEAGLVHLARRYLAGFGPATLKDIAGWAGVPASQIKPALASLPLRRFRDEKGAELFDLEDAPLPDPDTPAPVRFLHTWEAALLVHARRTQVLPERHRELVFHVRMPFSTPTFLVDGAVAGSWRYEDGLVRLNPFEALAPKVLRELEREAEALAAFHAD